MRQISFKEDWKKQDERVGDAYFWNSLNMFDSLAESLLEFETDDSYEEARDAGEGERDSSSDADKALSRVSSSSSSSLD